MVLNYRRFLAFPKAFDAVYNIIYRRNCCLTYQRQPLLLKASSTHALCSSPANYSAHQRENIESTKSSSPSTSKILYDGDCKLCQLEISALKRLTKNSHNLDFVNISHPDYDPNLWGSVSYEDAMKEMHVVGPDGTVYTKANAVRELYKACGFGWLASLTELPVVKPICDKLYIRFAKYRLKKALDRCDSGSCDIKLKSLRDKLEKEKELT